MEVLLVLALSPLGIAVALELLAVFSDDIGLLSVFFTALRIRYGSLHKGIVPPADIGIAQHFIRAVILFLQPFCRHVAVSQHGRIAHRNAADILIRHFHIAHLQIRPHALGMILLYRVRIDRFEHGIKCIQYLPLKSRGPSGHRHNTVMRYTLQSHVGL